MDEVIFEEFKGTGNMSSNWIDELRTDVSSQPLIWSHPVLEDDLLLDENAIQRMWIMRKYLADMNPVEAMEFINDRFKRTQNNEEFLISMNS